MSYISVFTKCQFVFTFLYYKVSVCVIHFYDTMYHFVSYMTVIQGVSLCLTFFNTRCQFVSYIFKYNVSYFSVI